MCRKGRGLVAMRNIEVAWIFYELADFLEYKGEEFFKVRAYRNAARVLAGLDEPLEVIAQRGGLAKIAGIGRNIASKINEILATGSLKVHADLSREIPAGLMEIMALPGLGPKRAALLNQRLGIVSLEDLSRAARQGLIRSLPGMGSKTESDIIRNIEMLEDRTGRFLLATARELAQEIMAYLKALPGVSKVEAGGSMRRWRETVGDIDLVAAASDPRAVLAEVEGHPGFRDVSNDGSGRICFLTRWGIPVDLEVVTEELFPITLFRSTGSKVHIRRIQEEFASRGGSLEVISLASSGKLVEEADIYSLLGLPYIPPELREDRGEVEAARENKLPRLLELGDIKGDLHIHTHWSDGVNSIQQVVGRAREKGYQYLAVTDHSQSLKIARGLSLGRLKEQHGQIRELNLELEDFHIFTGIEVDILPMGGLDCPDEILEEMDLVVASVHSGFKQDRETMTARIISAIENKNVDIIGHLTGRLINHRQGYALDVDRVLEAAAKCGTILEINSSPDRLDLDDINSRRAKEKGIKMVVSTDAHDLKRMDEMPYGVSVARRAWLEPGDVLNTLPKEELLEYLHKR